MPERGSRKRKSIAPLNCRGILICLAGEWAAGKRIGGRKVVDEWRERNGQRLGKPLFELREKILDAG